MNDTCHCQSGWTCLKCRDGLEADNERLTDLHRKAVAEAAILLAEKTDRDEEIERLRAVLKLVTELPFAKYTVEEVRQIARQPLAQSKEDGRA